MRDFHDHLSTRPAQGQSTGLGLGGTVHVSNLVVLAIIRTLSVDSSSLIKQNLAKG